MRRLAISVILLFLVFSSLSSPAWSQCSPSLVGGDTCGEGLTFFESFADTGGTQDFGGFSFADNYDPGLTTTCGISNDGVGLGPDVVYRVVPQGDGVMRITFTPDNWNASLYVVRNCGDINNSCEAAVIALSQVEIMDVPVTAGTTYHIVVDGFFGESGCYDIAVNLPSAAPGAPFASLGQCSAGIRADSGSLGTGWPFAAEPAGGAPSFSSAVQLLSSPNAPYRLDSICVLMRESATPIFEYELVIHASDGGQPGALLASAPLRATGIPGSGEGEWFSGTLAHLPAASRTLDVEGAFVGLRWNARGQGLVLFRDAGTPTVVNPANPAFFYRENGAFQNVLDSESNTLALFIRASGVFTGGGPGVEDCDGSISVIDPNTGNQGDGLLLAYRDPMLGGFQPGAEARFDIVAPPTAERLRTFLNGQESSLFSKPIPGSISFTTQPFPVPLLDLDRDTNLFSFYYSTLDNQFPPNFIEGAPCTFTLGWQAPVCQILPLPSTPVVGGNFDIVVRARNIRYDVLNGNFGVLDSNAPGWPGPVPLLPSQIQNIEPDGTAVFVSVFESFDFQPDLYGVYTVTVRGPGANGELSTSIGLAEGGEILPDSVSIGRRQTRFIGRAIDAALLGVEMCPSLRVNGQLVASGDCVTFNGVGHSRVFLLDYPEDAVPPGSEVLLTLAPVSCGEAPQLGASYGLRNGSVRGNERCDVGYPFTGSFRLEDSTGDRADWYQFGGACGGLSPNAGIGGDTVYPLRLPLDAVVSVNVQPEPGLDAVIYVVQDCENPGTSCVAASDQVIAGFQETLQFQAQAGSTYRIVVDGAGGSSGDFTLQVGLSAEAHNQVTQQYDDGAFDNLYGIASVPAGGFMTRVYPESATGRLETLYVPFSRSGTTSAVEFEVVFVREDLTDPFNPAYEVYERRNYAAGPVPSTPNSAFFAAELRLMHDPGVPFPDFIGVIWDNTGGLGLAVAADESPATALHEGFRTLDDGATWTPLDTLFNSYRALGLRIAYFEETVQSCVPDALAGDPPVLFDAYDGGFPTNGAPVLVRAFSLSPEDDPIGSFRWWALGGSPSAPLIPCVPGDTPIQLVVYADDNGEPGELIHEANVIARVAPTGRTRPIPNGPAVEYQVDVVLNEALDVKQGWLGV